MGELLHIAPGVEIDEDEVDLSAIRAQGAGGQNVNKVSSAIHLRFDIQASSLPDFYKSRLLSSGDSRITQDGVLVLKAQNQRTQERNKLDALERLVEILRAAGKRDKPRRPTRPTRSSQVKRMDKKKKQGRQKALRGKVDF